MKGFFNYDGKLNEILTKIMYLAATNMLFLLGSLPIFTIGASACAMYEVLLRFSEGDETDIIRTFFQAYRKNFKKATGAWLVMLGVAVTLALNYYLIFHWNNIAQGPVRIFMNLILVIWFFFWILLFPLIVRYENTLGGYAEVVLRLAVGHLPKMIIIILMHILPLFVIIYLAQYVGIAALLFVLCGFSLPAWLSSQILLPIFRRMEGQRE